MCFGSWLVINKVFGFGSLTMVLSSLVNKLDWSEWYKSHNLNRVFTIQVYNKLFGYNWNNVKYAGLLLKFYLLCLVMKLRGREYVDSWSRDRESIVKRRVLVTWYTRLRLVWEWQGSRAQRTVLLVESLMQNEFWPVVYVTNEIIKYLWIWDIRWSKQP